MSVRDRQLVIKREGVEVGRVPCEDVGVLVVDEAATVYTHGALMTLLESGAAVVVCGADHQPAGVLLPVAGNQLLSERLRDQVGAKRPLCKRLWRQIVRCKIRQQAALLGADHEAYGKLRALEKEVRSGDTSNAESQASRLYWRGLFGAGWVRRGREEPPPNNLLNYGYAVLRAAVGRAICAAGLHPSIGLHHHNRYNAFCLADDLMEPFRPMVDRRVKGVWEEGEAEITREAKAELLGVLADEVTVRGERGPLMVNLHRTAASLCKCYAGAAKELDLPEP